MAQYKVILAPEVGNQIQTIVEHWENRGEETRAQQILDKIIESIDELKNMPSRYPPVPNISTRGVIYRRILAGSYRIIFTIDEVQITVLVVDVDHERRDPGIIIERLS